jgi:hypothetical protein
VKKVGAIQVSLFVIIVAFLTIGIIREEPYEMLKKTITVCLECIGIG